jgi:hypothetical protein
MKRYRKRLSSIGAKQIQVAVLSAALCLGGCAAIPPSLNEAGNGINPRYLFGDRRPGTDASLIDDSDYLEYLEWKRWQVFQSYQEWKGIRREE